MIKYIYSAIKTLILAIISNISHTNIKYIERYLDVTCAQFEITVVLAL